MSQPSSPSHTSPLRIGVLGCARIVRRAMVAGIAGSGSAVLEGIASRSAKRAAAWAKEFGICKHYGSYEALIADPEIDAIYNALTNELHRDWTVRAAEAGKHILCEKPLGINLAHAEAIVHGCHKHGVVLMEAFMWRHHPRVRHAMELIREGRIGELRLVKMDFSFEAEPDEWILDPVRGGGAMNDIGCYGIDAARYFTGEEPDVVHVFSRWHSTGIDMTSAMSLSFANGTLAQIDCSLESPDRSRIELVGTKGSIELPEGVVPSPRSELLFKHDGTTEVISFDEVDQYAEEVKIFAASVKAGKLLAPAEDGIPNMRVLDAAYRSAREQTAIRLK